jgi:hypothetical protein
MSLCAEVGFIGCCHDLLAVNKRFSTDITLYELIAMIDKIRGRKLTRRT